jgi:type IV pilus assembly protein PilW
MNTHHRATRQSGLTLVEILVALTIGLIVLTGVVGVLIANRQTYRTSEALARMQENARFSFEILGRSIRAAGGNPCGADKVANVLKNRSTAWWADWSNAIRGFEGDNDDHDLQFPQATGSGPAARIAGTDALITLTGSLDPGYPIIDHNPNAAQLKINTNAHGLKNGDIVIACDTQQSAIFQITNANPSNNVIVHNTGTGSPGNCSKYLGYPTPPNCGASGPNNDPPSYSFESQGYLNRLSAHAWYIGYNPRNTRSLYRINLSGSSAQIEEVTPDVFDLQVDYLAQGSNSYVNASSITDWNQVIAVRLEITTQDPFVRDDNGNPLTRKWYTIFRVRNMQP